MINILNHSKFLILYIQLVISMIGILMEKNMLSYWMLILTSIIIPIVLLTTENKVLKEYIFILNIILVIGFITNNILIWYITFELVIIPMIFIISKGSSSLESKYRTYNRFIIYTLISGFCLLINVIFIIILTGTLNYYYYIIYNPFNLYIQLILFPLHLISYLIKLPIIPFHIWLPDTHGEAPTSGSVILAALLLKLGGVGILRWLIPLYPYAYFYFRPLLFLLGLLSSIYAAITTLRHIDIKKLIAYSSISHMGLILIGSISLSSISYKGLIYLLVSHGLVSSLLFLLIGSLYIRTGTRILVYYKGLSINMPLFSLFLFLSLLFNSSFPPSFSFWTELLILNGTFLYEIFGIINLLIVLFFSGVYSILLFSRISFSYNSLLTPLNDLTLREFLILIPLLLFNIIFPIY